MVAEAAQKAAALAATVQVADWLLKSVRDRDTIVMNGATNDILISDGDALHMPL
jgi:hypothetical protein